MGLKPLLLLLIPLLRATDLEAEPGALEDMLHWLDLKTSDLVDQGQKFSLYSTGD